MKVLIVKNNRNEGPGMIAAVLMEREIPYDIIELDNGDTFPSQKTYSAVVVLGGPESANDTTERMKSEVKAVREVLKSGIPYLGICLGMQVLVKAAGGSVVRCPEKEIGWRAPDREYFRIMITDAARRDPLFTGIPGKIPIFQLHSEMAVPSLVGEVLAFGDGCPVQVVKEGRLAYGIQGHPELTKDLLTTWLKTDGELSAMDRDAIMSDYREIEDEYRAIGKQLISNFFDAAQKE